MYAKLIDGNLIIAPKKLLSDDFIVYNPPEYMYREHGWEPVRYTTAPEAPSGYYYASGWEERDGEIVQVWALTPLPDDISEAEAYDIIFGGGDT
jgi:hypothetical protein